MDAATDPLEAIDAAGDGLHVVCNVDGAGYALPAHVVLEIETFTGATPVPGAPPWVAGLVQVRGRVVPAVDVRARLGLPPAARSLDTRVVIVEIGAEIGVDSGRRVIGLVVDAAREVVRFPDTTGDEATAGGLDDGLHPPHIQGVAVLGDRRFYLIDLVSLLGQE